MFILILGVESVMDESDSGLSADAYIQQHRALACLKQQEQQKLLECLKQAKIAQQHQLEQEICEKELAALRHRITQTMHNQTNQLPPAANQNGRMHHNKGVMSVASADTRVLPHYTTSQYSSQNTVNAATAITQSALAPMVSEPGPSLHTPITPDHRIVNRKAVTLKRRTGVPKPVVVKGMRLTSSCFSKYIISNHS